MAPNTAFDELAELFHEYGEDTRGIYAPWIQERVPGGRRAIDLGCGYGRFTGILADRYEDVLAIDVASRELQIARTRNSRSNVSYEHRKLTEVTMNRDGQFDLVMAVNVLHHAGPPQEVLPHVKDLVAPGGHALLIDIVDTAPHGARSTREWHVAEAFRDAYDSYTNPRRSRNAAVAAQVLRLRLDEVWLDMVTSQPRLTRNEFHETYSAAFPSALFFDNVHAVACAMHWVNTDT